jgi:uncharacterized membrane protein (UPF0127 family)
MVNGRQDRLAYVYNQTREIFVATEVTVANNYLLRLVGLVGKTASWAQPGRGLWIVPCHGVHTLGMMFPIDLIFLDREKRVIHIEEYVRPFRISKVIRRAVSVLELPVHTIYRSGTREGDCLEISWLRNAGTENHPGTPARAEFENKRKLYESSNAGSHRTQENRKRIA